MQRFLVLILIGIAFCIETVTAQVVSYDDEVVENLYFEYIQKGQIPPFFYAPVLTGSVNSAINAISSSQPVENQNQNGAVFSTFLAGSSTFYSKEETIEDVNFGAANNGIDYAKNYLSETPYFGIGFEFMSEAGFGGSLKLEIQRLFVNDYFEPFNISLTSVDQNFMQEGYAYYDNPYINILVGRIHSQLGYLYTDNIFFNNNIPYTDSVRVYIPFGKYFDLHWQITNIPSVESVYQKDIETGNDVDKDSPDYFYGFENDDFPSLILNAYQRFGFQTNSIRAGLTFNTFLVRRNNRVEFIDIFPFAEWHSSDVVPNNFSIGMDFSFVPKENILVSFQGGFDEFNGNVLGISDSEIPIIWSAIGTLQNTLTMKNINTFLSTNIGYTHYLWGNFSGKTVRDNAEALLASAVYRHHAENAMYMPYTSEFGPGSFWASLDSVISFNSDTFIKNMRIAPTLLFLLREPDTNLIDTPYENREESPEKEIYYSIEVPVSYSWKGMEARIAPSFHVKVLNASTVPWFELRLSFKADFLFSVFEEGEKMHINVGS